MNDDTPEGRLELFARAMELNDMTLTPESYMTDEPMMFIADVRAVCAKARAYDAEGGPDPFFAKVN
jgi:hypothetical protein